MVDGVRWNRPGLSLGDGIIPRQGLPARAATGGVGCAAQVSAHLQLFRLPERVLRRQSRQQEHAAFLSTRVRADGRRDSPGDGGGREATVGTRAGQPRSSRDHVRSICRVPRLRVLRCLPGLLRSRPAARAPAAARARDRRRGARTATCGTGLDPADDRTRACGMRRPAPSKG